MIDDLWFYVHLFALDVISMHISKAMAHFQVGQVLKF